MPSPTQKIGSQAESAALSYLRSQGFRLLERNWFCRFGEIDLVMWDRNELVFIEVRSRKNADFGRPEETLTRAKCLRLKRSARTFIHEQQLQGYFWRFDVVAVTGALVDHIRNAIVG